MATDVQIALQPQAGQDPAAALTAAAAKLVRASIETLIQQAGQPMTGKIIAPPPNLPAGLAQIAVADQILTLKLSQPLPTGTAVRVEVQQNPAGQPSVSVQQLPTPLPVTAVPMTAPRAPTPLPLPPAPQQAQVANPAAAPPPPQGAVTTAPTNPTPAPAASQLPPQPQSATPAPMAQAPMAQPAATTVVQAPPAAAPLPQPATSTPTAPSLATAGNATAPQPVTIPSAPSPVAATQTAPAQPSPAALLAPAPATSAPTPSPVQAGTPPSAPPVPATPAPMVQIQPPVGTTSPPATAPASPAPAATSRAPVPTAQPTPLPAQAQTAPLAQPQPAAPPQVLMQRLTQAFAPPPAAATPAPTPGSPAQLVLAAVTQAAAQQQSPGPLLQALAVRLPHLPAPVADAAGKVLASRISLDRGAPAGAAFKQAVLGSGVFLDAPAKTGAQPDLRQALTQLRGTLMAWLGDEIAPVAPVVRRPPPPARGAMPRGQAPDLPQAAEGSAKEAGKSLLSQTEGALSRVKLMQLSTHGADAARSGTATAAPTEWNLELPMMLGHELAMAQIQIGRDAKGKTDPKEKNWRLRFALKFSVLGEVGAQVVMVGARTSIAIWADEEATAETLEAMLPELAPALVAKGLELVSLTVRRGVPRDENQPSGRLMDSMR